MDFLIARASSFAIDVDYVIEIVAVLGGFWLLLAEIVLFYFIFRFSKKNNPKAAYVTGEKHQEMKWIHWPHNLIVLCDVVIIIFAIKAWYHVKQTLPTPEETIRVTGKQWVWKFQHPGPDGVLDTSDDFTLVDELHLKVNTTYHFKLESDDVLHSFSIPVFRFKQDAVPGRTITGWFKPTKTGQFDIQCAEMCGIGHGIMGAKLHVQTATDYEAWMNQIKASMVNVMDASGSTEASYAKQN